MLVEDLWYLVRCLELFKRKSSATLKIMSTSLPFYFGSFSHSSAGTAAERLEIRRGRRFRKADACGIFDDGVRLASLTQQSVDELWVNHTLLS